MEKTFSDNEVPCFICCKNTLDFQPHLDDIIKRRHSLRLLSRQLGLNSQDWDNSRWRSCRDCFVLLEDYAEVYHAWKCTELQLTFLIYKIQNVIKLADKVPSRVDNFRKWAEKRDDEDSVRVRADLKRKCKRHRASQLPRVKLSLPLTHDDFALTDEQHEVSAGGNADDSVNDRLLPWIIVMLMLLSLSMRMEIFEKDDTASLCSEETWSELDTGHHEEEPNICQVEAQEAEIGQLVEEDADGFQVEKVITIKYPTFDDDNSQTLPLHVESQRRLRSIFRCEHCRVTFSSEARLEAHIRTCDKKWIMADSEMESAVDDYFQVACTARGRLLRSKSPIGESVNGFRPDYAPSSSLTLFTGDLQQAHDLQAYEPESSDFHTQMESDNQLGIVNVRDDWDEGSHNCEICHRSFLSLSALQVHMWSHPKGSDSFSNEMEYRNPNQPEDFSMSSCNQEGSYLYGTDQDRKRMEIDSCREQAAADAVMESATSLQIISTGGTWRCPYCDKIFSTHQKLYLHARAHRKVFNCSSCGKQFSTKTNLAVHIRTHTGEKPYKRDTCGSRFANKPNLVCHRRLHSGENPFACATCGRRFANRINWRQHSSMHTGERPFNCNNCGKGFRTKGIAKTHEKGHSGNIEKKSVNCKCPTCGQTFKSINSLRFHMKRHEVIVQPSTSGSNNADNPSDIILID